MKILSALLLSASIIASSSAFGQIFWTENFETGAATGLQVSSYSSSNGAWSLAITGTEGADPNLWYVSCQEAGQLAGTCGNTCSASPGLGASLHIGSNPAWLGDNGASYDAGGLCGIIACPQTDRRATSPTINCTGKSNIRLKFYYLLNGRVALMMVAFITHQITGLHGLCCLRHQKRRFVRVLRVVGIP